MTIVLKVWPLLDLLDRLHEGEIASNRREICVTNSQGCAETCIFSPVLLVVLLVLLLLTDGILAWA